MKKETTKKSNVRPKKQLKLTKAKPTASTKKVKVAIIESELGWGRKIDSIEEFDSLAEAQVFISNFNARNTSPTAPDWYMMAELMD